MDDVDLGPTRGIRREERSTYAPTLAEIFNQSTEDARRVANWNAHRYNLTEVYDDVADRVKAATGETVDNPLRGWTTDPQAAWKESIGKLKAKKPDALDWDAIAAEPETRAWGMMKETREKSDEMGHVLGLADAKAGVLGGVPIMGSVAALTRNVVTQPSTVLAQMAGSLYGQLSSPVDTAGNLVGFGAAGAATSIVKAAVMNALSNAAVQGVLSAGKQGDYAKAGLPHGWKVWLEEVEGAAATGLALDAGIRMPGRAAISRFGRDVEPGKAFSKNTVRGGFLRDAEAPALPGAKPGAAPDSTGQQAPDARIAPETLRKAANDDSVAVREVLEKTGSMEDPAVRGASNHLDGAGRLTEDTLRELKELGVERVYGMRMLAEAIEGRHALVPAPVAPAADGPLMPQLGTRLLDQIGARLESFPEGIRRAVQDGLEAGVPEIVKAVRAEIARGDDGLGSGIASLGDRLAKVITLPMVDRARIHSGLASATEIAQMIRRAPGVLDANTALNTDRMRMARDLATLEDTAFDAVANHHVPAEIGVLVAQRVPHGTQAGIIADIAKLAPKTLLEARDILDQIAPSPSPGRKALVPHGSEGAGEVTPERMEALRGEAGKAYEEAKAPLERRAELESKIEDIKGKIASAQMKTDDRTDAPGRRNRTISDEIKNIDDELERLQQGLDRITEEIEDRQYTADLREVIKEEWQRYLDMEAGATVGRSFEDINDVAANLVEHMKVAGSPLDTVDYVFPINNIDDIKHAFSASTKERRDSWMSADMDHIEDLMERQSDITNEINKLKSTRDSAARQFADPEMGEPMARDEASDRGAESDPATAGAPAIEKQRAELAAAERELARIEKEIAREIEANDPVSLKANLAEAERARQLAELTAACRE